MSERNLLAKVEDRTLVKRMQAGERDAYDELVSRHRNHFWSIALSIVRHAEDAEDVLQNALFKMYDKCHTFNADGPWIAWASTVVRNTSLMHLRRHKRRGEVQLDDFVKDSQKASPLESPHKILISKEIREALADALERLGPKYRIPFELAMFQGLSMTEIGQVIGESEGCAKTRMHRARTHLRRALAGAQREFLA